MHELDGSFKQAKAKSRLRKRRRLVRRLIAAAALLCLVVAIGVSALYWPILRGSFGGAPGNQPADVPDEEAQPVYIPAIVDLAGNPMKISLGDDASLQQKTRAVARPDAIPAERVATQVALLSDVMISTSQRFMTTLPSSPNDFAFYQSQRQPSVQPVAQAPSPTPPTATVPAATSGDLSASGGGWGEDLTSNGPPTETVERTRVEDTTSVATVKDETLRFKPDKDIAVRITAKGTVQSVFKDNGLPASEAELYGQAMTTLLNKSGFDPGDVVAVRSIKSSATAPAKVVQMSVYANSAYVGTLALGDAGSIVLGADPWVPDNLFNYHGEDSVAEPGRQYRLLDAIYSTAVRNRVPTGVLGETIMLLSRRFDLNAFASPDDQLIIAYAQGGNGDDGGVGRVLYAAVRGTDRDMECYVFRATTRDDFSCFSQGGASTGGATVNGMVAPVKGVMTSKFGPRMHPIFHEVRVHTGVDWAAPVGSPVVAAFDGQVVSAGNGGGYGNLLKIGHGGGRESWYAHLSAFAEGIVAGKAVKAGDLVGYVGTTGNSTGPHLHFEIRMAGVPVDPLQETPTFVASSGSAVEVLTERIVQVESGGSATAKNPLSSATGAGQFISSTWLRMMGTYRPDLSRTMSVADLLDLRNDPTIAREMVQNLAREGEAYLKARGHDVTPGRLYLCHFLGMEDAHRILSADGTLPLESVLSGSVMDANPFLKGHDVNYVINWAEQKMSGGRVPSAPSVPAQPQSPEFELYKVAITAMLAGEASAPGGEAGTPAAEASPPTDAAD